MNDDRSDKARGLSLRWEAILLPIIAVGVFALFFPVLGHPARLCDRADAWPLGFRGRGPEGVTVFVVVVVVVEMLRRGLSDLHRWEDGVYIALLCGGVTFGLCALVAKAIYILHGCAA